MKKCDSPVRKASICHVEAKTSSVVNSGCLLLFSVNFVFPVLRKKNKAIIAALSEEHWNAT